MKALLEALSYLPELIKLYKAFEKTRTYSPGESIEKRKRLKGELNELEKAIKEKDIVKLNNILNDMEPPH